MKKLLTILMTVALCAAAALAQVATKDINPDVIDFQSGNSVSASPVVNVTAPTLNVDPGTSFNVPVSVSDTTGLGIIAYQFDLHYDPAVIQPQTNAVDVTGTISSNLVAVYNPISPGTIKVAVYGAYPLTGAGTLINFKFTAVGPLGSNSSLSWVDFMFNEGNPAANVASGMVKIVSSAPSVGATNFTGRESVAGVRDMLNDIYRDNSFVMISDDTANGSSMTVSFDSAPMEGIAGSYSVVGGQWSLTVFKNGQYYGSLFGDITRGRVTDTLNSGGTALRRAIKGAFKIRGGIGGYENIRVRELSAVDFTLKADYENGKKATALVSFF